MALASAVSMPWIGHAQVAAKPIKISVLVGLSGPGAPYGNDAVSGVQAVIDQVNKAGGIKSLGGAQIQIEPADHQGKPDLAQTLVERLAPGVIGFIGCANSSASILGTQAAERLRIPFVTADQDDRIVDRNFAYTFKVTPRMGALTESSIDFLKFVRDDMRKPVGKIGIIYSSEEPGSVTMHDTLKRDMPKMGFQIVESIGVSMSAAEFIPILQRLRDAGTETLYWNVAPSASLRLVGGLKQLQWRPYQLTNTGGPMLKFFTDQLGDYVDGLNVVNYFAADTKLEAANRLNELYKPHNAGKNMATLAGSNASAASVLVAGLEAAGSTDGTALANAIRKLNLKPGDFNYCMPGGVSFDKAGQNIRAQTIVTVIRKAQHRVVWPKEFAVEAVAWTPV